MPQYDKEKPAEQILLCYSKNGVRVMYDPVYSHAATHLEDTPPLKSLVSELIEAMDLTGQEVKTYFDVGRIVGTTDVVMTDETDEIVYAMRKNRSDDGLVPFTKTSPAEPCQYVSMDLAPTKDDTYELLSAWIGTWEEDDQPFPQSANATDKSAEFWHKQAFVWGSQEIIPGTETSETPW